MFSNKKMTERPWGNYQTLFQENKTLVKKIVVKPKIEQSNVK